MHRGSAAQQQQPRRDEPAGSDNRANTFFPQPHQSPGARPSPFHHSIPNARTAADAWDPDPQGPDIEDRDDENEGAVRFKLRLAAHGGMAFK